MLPLLKQRGLKPCTEARTLVPRATAGQLVKGRANVQVLLVLPRGGGAAPLRAQMWGSSPVTPEEARRASVACSPQLNSSKAAPV